MVASEEFEKAVAAMRSEDYNAADRSFRKIFSTLDPHDKRYNLIASYTGLAMAIVGNGDGLLISRDAASNEVIDGQVFLNLACTEWVMNNRRRAINAIKRGIKIDGQNPALNAACARLDCRRRCCFGFLPRGHRLNRFFGRLRRKDGPVVTVNTLLFPPAMA